MQPKIHQKILNMKYLKQILVISILFAANISLKAQSPHFIDTMYFEVVDSEHGYYKIKDASSASVENVISRLKTMYNLSTGDTYVLLGTTSSINGMLHKKYQHLHNGISVRNSRLIIHTSESGSILTVNGSFVSAIDPKYRVNKTELQAITSAIDAAKAVGVTTFLWEETSYERALKEEKNDKNATYYPTAKLMYYPGTDNIYIPVYEVTIRSFKPFASEYFYINADNGSLLLKVSALENCFAEHKTKAKPVKQPALKASEQKPILDPTSCNGDCNSGSGGTIMYNSQNQSIAIGKHQFGIDCKYRLLESCDGQPLHTVSRTIVSSNSGSSPNFEYTDQNTTFNFSPTKHGVQVHWGLEQALEFYRVKWNRSSMDGNKNAIFAVLNDTIFGTENAFYDRISDEISFTPPSANFSSGLISLDIVAHEFTHGISKYEVGWNLTGEPGALNESFSDILGKMIEFYAKSNHSTGTNFTYVYMNDATSNMTILRDMSQPSNTGNPNFFGGTNWINPTSSIDDGGRHTNCQVQNYWFYLLAEGGAGNLGSLGDYCVKALGKDAATRIVYESLTNCITSGATNFAGARAASIAAATNLYGVNSNEVAQCTQAWFAVGVGGRYNGKMLLQNHTATGSETYKDWNCKVEVSNFNTNSGSNVTITSGTEISLLPGVSYLANSEVRNYIAISNCTGSARLSDTQGLNETAVDQNVGDINSKPMNVFKYTVMPNPTSGSVKVSLQNAVEYPTQIVVMNLLGNVLLEKKDLASFEVELDITKLPVGMYFIRFQCNNQAYSSRIIKN